MNDDQLKAAMDTVGERLQELRRLKSIVADLCQAAENVIGVVNSQSTVGTHEPLTMLKMMIGRAYSAGVKPSGE